MVFMNYFNNSMVGESKEKGYMYGMYNNFDIYTFLITLSSFQNVITFFNGSGA